MERRQRAWSSGSRLAGIARPSSHGSVLLALVLLVFTSWGCAPSSEGARNAQRRQAVEGEVDERHTSVFRVITRASGFNGLCSATLIAPNLLLTARHCVANTPAQSVACATDRFDPAVSESELLFANDAEPTLASEWYAAAAVIVAESDVFCGNDVALVVLEDPIPDQRASVSPPRLQQDVSVGEVYTAVGYGGSDGDAEISEYGARRSLADRIVDCVGLGCLDDVTTTEFAGSDGACGGDSGGPALDADGQVIGVLSRGAQGCASPVYSSVFAFADLIQRGGEVAAEGAPAPAWLRDGGARDPTAGPSDGSSGSGNSDAGSSDSGNSDAGSSDEAVDGEAASDAGSRDAATLVDEGERDANAPRVLPESGGCALRPSGAPSNEPIGFGCLLAFTLFGVARRAARRRSGERACVSAVVGCVLLLASGARAHELGFASAELRFEGERVEVELVVDAPLAESLGDDQRRARLRATLADALVLDLDGVSPELDFRVVALGRGPSAVDVVQYRAPKPASPRRLELGFIEAVGDVAVEVGNPAGERVHQSLLSAGSRSGVLSLDPPKRAEPSLSPEPARAAELRENELRQEKARTPAAAPQGAAKSELVASTAVWWIPLGASLIALVVFWAVLRRRSGALAASGVLPSQRP